VRDARECELDSADATCAARQPWRRGSARAVAGEIRTKPRGARESDWPKDLRALSFADELLRTRAVRAERARARDLPMTHTHKRLVDYADCAG